MSLPTKCSSHHVFIEFLRLLNLCQAPSEARFLPACAAALAALMMALSLGVDATPPAVRREPQETKDWGPR